MAEPVKIGGGVWYVAADGKGQMALVNGIMPKKRGGNPMLNLTVVSMDQRKEDPYGQQNEPRLTGVPHEDDMAEGGHYWQHLWPCEPK